ncbi:hypothetical protein GCM10023238_31990 [Streptomyces heliomycini]
MTPDDPRAGLERWRLILGAPAERRTGGLDGPDAARDTALQWLYGRDDDLARRGERRGTADGREGGDGPSTLAVVDWLDDIHRLFPRRRSNASNATPWRPTASTRSSPIPTFFSA